ncbi:type VI secretion system Vgr family protein [Paraburkholderia sp. J67]|uniref:type VI secretion system Vgr family protein n=1 Tax=Paraburkholderia sp. J67 TaxID=2805435 RepID=UPI002ABDE7F5|nr:type VI secretion system tip protein TssI/VgrG [Paraburkholderia sp. J67]
MAWQIQKRAVTFTGDELPEVVHTGYNRERIREPLLTVRSVEGREGVGQQFEYVIKAEVANPEWLQDPHDAAQLDLQSLIGSPGTIAIQITGIGSYQKGQPGYTGYPNKGANIRYINGTIITAEIEGTEDRGAIYRFVLAPTAWDATQNSDSRIYRGNVIEVLERALERYGLIEWRIGGPWGGRKTYPPRDYIRQAWESNWTFAHRIMEEWGLTYWYEHSEHSHTLVITDSMGGYHPHGVAYEKLRYHTGSRIDEEHVSELRVSYSATASKAVVNDHDYNGTRMRRSLVQNREEYEDSRGTADPNIKLYTSAAYAQPDAGHGHFSDNDMHEEGQYLARVTLEAARCKGVRAFGKGHLTGLQSGRTTTVFNFPQDAANREYVVHTVYMKLVDVGTGTGRDRTYSIETEFELHPVTEYLRLPQVTPRPRIDHFERAVIVSPNDAEVWVDKYNRALVRFTWDRKEDFTGRNSIWVRLGMQWQGNQMGTVFHARAGQEVLIGYEEGDCDRPFIAHFVVNNFNMPPWEMSTNQALSGVVTKSLGYGGTSNLLGFDDTQGKQQVQLASDHGKSSLALGYNTRIEGNKGRQDARGEGVDLRTDLKAAIRAAMGLLITTWARIGAVGKALEIAETIARLTQARDLQERMAGIAQKNGAQGATGEQADVAKDIKEINAALRGQAGHREDDFPEFENPDIAVSSAGNLHTTAAGTAHFASERHTAISAGGSVAIASAGSFLASVIERISLYSHKAGVFIGSAFGKVRVHAQASTLDLAGHGNVTVLSENGTVFVLGKERIVLRAGESEVVIDAQGVTARTRGEVRLHGADHATDAPLAAPSHFAVVAPYPMTVSCAAFNAVEATDTGESRSAVPSPASSTSAAVASLSPAPSPQMLSASDMQSAAGMMPAGLPASLPAAQASTAPAGTTAPQATTPVHAPTEPCKINDLRDIPMSEVTWDMECADYWGLLADGSPYIDEKTGKQKFIRMAGSNGTFDIGFDKASKTLTMRVIVLVIPRSVKEKSPTSATPDVETPYESARDNDPRFDEQFLKSDRPVSEITNLANMKQKIETFLNGNNYKMALKQCPFSSPADTCTPDAPSGTAPLWQSTCVQQVNVKFEIDFITDPKQRAHRRVNLYPMSMRADSGNWGERNVIRNKKKTEWIDNPIEHVQAHETGHLFSFPDEYFDAGGSIHKNYITAEQKVNLPLANHNPDLNTWQGVGNRTLMGPGVYLATPRFPSYYLQRAVDWFDRQTGKSWVVTPRIEA